MNHCIIHGCVWCTCRPRTLNWAAIRERSEQRKRELEAYAATPEGTAEAERVRQLLLDAVEQWRRERT